MAVLEISATRRKGPIGWEGVIIVWREQGDLLQAAWRRWICHSDKGFIRWEGWRG